MSGITVDDVHDVEPLQTDMVARAAKAAIDEVWRQDDLARSGKFHGTHILPGGPDHARLGVLVEEVGEVARELNESFNPSKAESHPRLALYKELIQVAASAIAWAAAIEEGR